MKKRRAMQADFEAPVIADSVNAMIVMPDLASKAGLISPDEYGELVMIGKG